MPLFFISQTWCGRIIIDSVKSSWALCILVHSVNSPVEICIFVDSVKSPVAICIIIDSVKSPRVNMYYFWQCEEPASHYVLLLTVWRAREPICIIINIVKSPFANISYYWQWVEPASNMYYYWQCLRSNHVIIDSVKSPRASHPPIIELGPVNQTLTRHGPDHFIFSTSFAKHKRRWIDDSVDQEYLTTFPLIATNKPIVKGPYKTDIMIYLFNVFSFAYFWHIDYSTWSWSVLEIFKAILQRCKKPSYSELKPYCILYLYSSACTLYNMQPYTSSYNINRSKATS